MALIRLRDICLAFGPEALLDHADLVVDAGDRIAVLGRNGQGKSTLLKVISGDLTPDSGQLEFSDNVSIARLQQEVPNSADDRTVFEVVASGHSASTAQALLEIYQTGAVSVDAEHDIWQLSANVQSVITQLSLNADDVISHLSGGQKRRAMLARALVTQPQILLMDEPTNHLDVASVVWLENFLRKLRVTMIFVTHDRELIRALANRIVEIDRGTLTSWKQTYDKYLVSREQANAAQAEHDRLFDKKLKQEETWIRQGIKARRTRNEGRVRALKKLREERAQRREQIGQVNMQVQTGNKSGRIVFELQQVGHAFENKTILRSFSTTIMRGQKVAIIGPNGSGKTTLLKIILGNLTPDSGTATQGTNLAVAYFDQLRTQLNDKLNAADNVSEGADFVDINGSRKHIMGYMQEFLFSPERARAPITALSGGERNRLLLAKLFTKPANVLVLDEPTNDLDVETLELLEYTVLNFTGTVLVVSHDREFIDNIATTTIAFETDGTVREYVGGYSDYQKQKPAPVSTDKKSNNANTKANKTASNPTQSKVKLSYKLQRELDQLPARIEALEEEKASLESAMADPELYQQGGSKLSEIQEQYTSLETALASAYERWDELESMAG